MGFLSRLFSGKQENNDEKKDIIISDDLGTIEPFTVFENGQFSNFVSILATNEDVNENVKKAFNELWQCACTDIDGFGNNIWCLKEGVFEIYNKEGICIQFEKKSSKEIDKGTDQGRADFIYKSTEGNLVIHQHERNNRIFLLYVSNITEQFINMLRDAEYEALGIKKANIRDKYKVNVPTIESKGNQIKSISPQVNAEERG